MSLTLKIGNEADNDCNSKGGMAEAGTPVTMSDVAGSAGVSTASVSRIVNGRYDVSAIAEVCSAIERPGYEPAAAAVPAFWVRVTHSFQSCTAEVLKGVMER